MHMAERKDETKMASCRSHEYPAQALSLNSVSQVPSVCTNKRKRSTTKREVFKKCHKKRDKRDKRKRKKEGEKEREKAQHRAFPRGPPPQYYPGSNLLNFAVRMGSGEPG